MRPTRLVPSTRALMAFDAVVRHGSVTRAAGELRLTQSTVSRLIASLEEQLGLVLFARERKRLIPTPAALAYARDVGRALDMIQRASTALVANPDGGTISLAVLPTFGARWLGPRLGGFLSTHPGVSVTFSTRIKPDFGAEGFDAAAIFGADILPGLRHVKLFDERVTACAAPGKLDAGQLADPARLLEQTLLYLETRPGDWADWFAAQGHPGLEPRGAMMMDQFSMMIQAAISGIGIALLPTYIADVEIAEGRLVPLFTRAVPMRGSYWLVWPPERDGFPPLMALRDWLAVEAAGETQAEGLH